MVWYCRLCRRCSTLEEEWWRIEVGVDVVFVAVVAGGIGVGRRWMRWRNGMRMLRTL